MSLLKWLSRKDCFNLLLSIGKAHYEQKYFIMALRAISEAELNYKYYKTF